MYQDPPPKNIFGHNIYIYIYYMLHYKRIFIQPVDIDKPMVYSSLIEKGCVIIIRVNKFRRHLDRPDIIFDKNWSIYVHKLLYKIC